MARHDRLFRTPHADVTSGGKQIENSDFRQGMEAKRYAHDAQAARDIQTPRTGWLLIPAVLIAHAPADQMRGQAGYVHLPAVRVARKRHAVIPAHVPKRERIVRHGKHGLALANAVKRCRRIGATRAIIVHADQAQAVVQPFTSVCEQMKRPCRADPPRPPARRADYRKRNHDCPGQRTGPEEREASGARSCRSRCNRNGA